MRVVLIAALLAGCASADPNLWLLYAKAAHTYGRIEAKSELLCAPEQLQTQPGNRDYCVEVKRVREAVEVIKPVIESELTKTEPDYARIMQYLDLVLSLASKAL